jgi:hypothetical protein
LYRTGQFWSWANSGEAREWVLVQDKGVGQGDPDQTKRLIVFLHETSHYLHDLSLGACIAADYAREESVAALMAGLHTLSVRNARVLAPLTKSGEMARWLADAELKPVAECAREREDWIEATWTRTPPALFEYCARRKFFAEALDCVANLTGEAVCEGLVAAKTLWALNDRIGSYADIKYLDTIKHTLQVFPENLPPLYNIARRIYDVGFGDLLENNDGSLRKSGQPATSLRHVFGPI